MDLVRCPNCGGEVAEQLSECPQCGKSLFPPAAAPPPETGAPVDADPGVQQGLAEGRLRTCPDCFALVSTQLAACHRCGHPFGGARPGWGGAPTAETGWTDEAGWDQAYRGLRLYRTGLITYVVAVFASYLVLVLAAVARSPTMAQTMVLAAGIALLIGHAMMVTGQYRFTSIPQESGARSLAWVGFVGGLIAVALSAVALLCALTGSMKASASAASGVGSIAWVVGSICFILAMAGVARYVESPHLGRQAILVLVMLLVFLGLGVAYEYVGFLLNRAIAARIHYTKISELQGLAVLILIPWAVVGILYLLKFLQLLATLTAILGEGAVDEEEDDEDLSY